jgi:hypothetical protein
MVCRFLRVSLVSFSDVSTSNGLPIPAGESRKFRLSYLDEMWAVASGAGTVAVVSVAHGKGGLPFSPLDLSPVLWLDASDTSTISETAGAVDTWSDKSGNGNDVTEATADKQPTTGANTLNGSNVIDFSSSSLGNASFAVSQPFTVFFVAEPDGNHGGFLFDEINLGTRVTMSHYWGANTVRIDAGTAVDSGVVLSAATATLFRATFNSTSSSIFVDGSSVASGDAGTNDLDSGIRMGSGWNKNDGYTGAIAEIIFVNGTLTASQIADTETYLAAKWGITI